MASTRLDRLLTIGVVHPIMRSCRRIKAPQQSLPILMYHSISDNADPALASYYRTVTTTKRFAEQMQFLHSHGYQAVSLQRGLELLKRPPARSSSNHQPSPRFVVLTFDDGFLDFYTAAVPTLKEFGFSATMFLPTAFISNNGTHRQFLGRDCLTWSDVRELHSAGIEFGSHTVSHPNLVDLSWSKIESELTHSKSEIEQKLGCAIASFAYPYAFPQNNTPFIQRLSETLSKAGYQSCVTTEIGCTSSGDNLLRLKRLPVNDADDTTFLKAKLDGAYDWLAWPQRAKKFLKAQPRR